MPGGRPRLPGTNEERAERRRLQLLKNVRAHRERRRTAARGGTSRVNDVTTSNIRSSPLAQTPSGDEIPAVGNELPAFVEVEPVALPYDYHAVVEDEPITCGVFDHLDITSIEENIIIPGYVLDTPALPKYDDSPISILNRERTDFSTKDCLISTPNVRPADEGEALAADEMEYLDWFSRRLPYKFHFGPSYRDMFVDASIVPDSHHTRGASSFVRGLLPINIICGSFYWNISRAAAARANCNEKHLLSDLFLASALKEAGEVQRSPPLLALAAQTHSRLTLKISKRVLRFQKAPTRRIEDALMLSRTIMAFAMAELVMHRSWTRFILHVRGAGAILQSAGPEIIKSPTSQRHYLGYRHIELAFSLMERRHLFPSDAQWACSQYSSDSEDKMINQLVDLAFLIPPELELFDRSRNCRPADLYIQLRRVQDIHKRLVAWRCSVSVNDPWTPTPSPNIRDGPRFVVNFSSDLIANMMIAYCGFIITLLDLGVDIATCLVNKGDEQVLVLRNELDKETLTWVLKGQETLQLFLASEPSALGKINCLYMMDATWTACKKRDLPDDVFRAFADEFEKRGLPVLRRH